MAKKKKRLVLLDSHAILHRAFHALPDFTSPKGEPTGALYGFMSMFLKMERDLQPDYLMACFDLPKPTFRHKMYKEYKAQRPKMDVGLSAQIAKSKDILELFGVPVYEKAGFEADDILASVVYQLKREKKNKIKNKDLEIVIVSGDLDTLQLVGGGVKVYTMKKGIKDTIIYDKKGVEERFGFSPDFLTDYKGLRGDPSDNIIGVPGVGEKTATILIQNFKHIENIYETIKKDEEALLKKGIKPRIINILKENEEEALFSKSLAETRNDVPIDFSLKDALWGDGAKEDEIKNLFVELGFRSLLPRLPFTNEDQKKEVQQEKITKNDPLEEEKLKLAFWVLDSRRTNSDLEEILLFTGTKNLVDAEKFLKQELKKEGLFKLYAEVEEPLMSVFSKMEKQGILLDTVYLKKLSKKYHQKLTSLEKKIWHLAGREFNIASPKQLSEILFEEMGISTKGVRKTSQGMFSTRFSELEKIKDRHEIVEEIFTYRSLAKLISTYVDNLPDMVDKDSRLHTSFKQRGTTTGRISSSEPNLQNIPIRKEEGRAVRRAFVAPKGCQLVSFDYSQIELRVAASLSGDEKMKEAFNKGEDIHNKVAAEVFNVSLDQVDYEMRRKAKIINFGIIYGMGINSLKKNLMCSQGEAREFYAEYFNNFSAIQEYLEKTKEFAAKNNYVETLFKRRRYLPEINSPLVFLRKEAERMAINAPIQGTAADILKMAMVKINQTLTEKKLKKKVKMILQVHDELIFEIENATIKEASVLIKNILEEIDLPGVPLLADVLCGNNWADMEKVEL